VEQVIAELVANAVAATRGVRWVPKQPPVRLWLLGSGGQGNDDLGNRGQGSGGQVMVVVWDAGTAPPVQRSPGREAESGRGLLLVDAFADWGYYLPPPNYGGKVVHALLPKAERSR
jgi:hypothetical protein